MEAVRCIPSIWYTFTTTKDLGTCQNEIKVGMEKWGDNKRVEIDRSMYLEEDMLKAITQLQFKPSGSGAGVALAQSANKGLSMLVC